MIVSFVLGGLLIWSAPGHVTRLRVRPAARGQGRGSTELMRKYLPTVHAKLHPDQAEQAVHLKGVGEAGFQLLHDVEDLLKVGLPPGSAWQTVGVRCDEWGIPLTPSVERRLLEMASAGGSGAVGVRSGAGNYAALAAGTASSAAAGAASSAAAGAASSAATGGPAPTGPATGGVNPAPAHSPNAGTAGLRYQGGDSSDIGHQTGPRLPAHEQELARNLAHLVAVSASVSHRLGLSLSAVFATVQGTLRRSMEADEERRISLAGPQASARLLQLLPLAGLGGAYLLGVDPIAWYLTSPLGLAVGVVGVGLLLVGRAWTSRLIRQAKEAR